jgi:hypothetical protein
MTLEDKKIVIKDICGRLPYKVKIHIGKTQRIEVFDDINLDVGYINNSYADIRPYLFPLSSMTEEQKDYIRNRFCYEWESDEEVSDLWKHKLEFGDALEFIQWCCENHLDINSLIPKGLAIDATDKNIY